MTELETQTLDKNRLNELVMQIARERDLQSEEVFALIEEALARVLERNIDRLGLFRVKIDQETYQMDAKRYWEVIDDDEMIENVSAQKTLEYALEMDPDVKVGGEVSIEVEAPDLDRHSNAQTFKQKYLYCLRKAEHNKLLDELLAREEQLVNGTVKRIDKFSGDLIIEVHRVECRLRRSDSIPKEMLRPGDRVRCLIKEIKDDPNRGRKVYLTRTSEDFLRELFRREVPEIEKGTLEIVAVSRDPGYRSKIAVSSRDPKVDPIGTCVGMRGSRVQSVTADLGGEKVDIIPWDENEIEFVQRALAPAEISMIRVVAPQCCDVIVEDDKLAQAIGKAGMNVKLASRLTGWQINITDSKDGEAREQERIGGKQKYFMERLDVDEAVARILYEEGFNSIDDLVETERSEFLEIEGFDETVVEAIMARAKEAYAQANTEYKAKLAKCEPTLLEIASDEQVRRSLLDKDVFTVQQLAEYGIDDLLEIAHDVSEDEAKDLIMSARRHSGLLDEESEVQTK